MDATDLLTDCFERVRESVAASVQGLDEHDLVWRPDPGANSIAWLVWHLSRIADAQVAEIVDVEEAWTAEGWAARFGLALYPDDTGFGHSPEQVAAVRVDDPALLAGYQDAVAALCCRAVAGLDTTALDRIVDRSWDPPVSAGVRLVSVVADALEHAGQAAYLRGLLDRR